MYSPGNMRKIPFKTLRHALTVPAVKSLIFVTAVSPRFLNRLSALIIGKALAFLPLPSGRVIKKNQLSVMAENGIHASSSQIYTSVLSSFFDFFHFSYRSDDALLKVLRVNGAENMKEALSHGKGVIAVTAHFGAWELLPRLIKLLGHKVGVVGRSLNLKNASQVLDKLRQKPGIRTVDRDAGAAPLLRLLRSNHVVGILIDQATRSVQSESINFLGQPARTPAAPAVLAKRLGAPIVTIHIIREKDSTYLLEIDKPLYFSKEDSTFKILELLNGRISSWILKNPEQWVWFHKRWRL